jgi:AmiR/NasT family two-component response regulator
MADATLILLQKQETALNPALSEALARHGGKRLVTNTTPPLPQVAYSPQGLVLWDVSTFSDIELRSMIRDLASEHLGVLLAGPSQSQALNQVLQQIKPLGIVTPDQPADALGVTIELAWANHRQVHALRGELDKLRQELSDRLVVEKAKRLLMENLGYSEGDAMRRLQRYSRNTNQKLAKVAQHLIAGYEVFGEDFEPA